MVSIRWKAEWQVGETNFCLSRIGQSETMILTTSRGVSLRLRSEEWLALRQALDGVYPEIDAADASRDRIEIPTERAGLPWTLEEDRLLQAAFKNGSRTSDLASRHKRTEGAIAARLVHLGLVPNRQVAR